MTSIAKQADLNRTDDPSYIVNTLNPFSQIFALQDYVPKTWTTAFNPVMSPSSSHILFKTLVGALGAAALFGGSRYLAHMSDMTDTKKLQNPAEDLAKNMNTTFEAPIEKLPVPNVNKPGRKKASGEETTTWGEAFLSAGLPTLASAAAAMIAYKQMDSWADKAYAEKLDEGIKADTKRRDALIAARALIPKGKLTAEQYAKVMGNRKTASGGLDMAAALAGLVVLGLFGAGAYGGYKYTAENSAAHTKYKALKAGLNEYAKQRSLHTPLDVDPIPQSVFKAIDGDQAQKVTPRDYPEVQNDALTPVSVSL